MLVSKTFCAGFGCCEKRLFQPPDSQADYQHNDENEVRDEFSHVITSFLDSSKDNFVPPFIKVSLEHIGVIDAACAQPRKGGLQDGAGGNFVHPVRRFLCIPADSAHHRSLPKFERNLSYLEMDARIPPVWSRIRN
jgi:hypothetical protein